MKNEINPPSRFGLRVVAFNTRLLLAAIISITAVTDMRAAMRCVNVNSASPSSPYTSWATAAMTIQDAIDVALAGDEIVVTNGIYQTGGDGTNRVVVTKPLFLRSVNGPAVTVIRGNGLRCTYLATGAALAGFTLTNGETASYNGGAGVLCESANTAISNCTFAGNSAYDGLGGGAFGGTFNSCTFTDNSSRYGGGGASRSTLSNCTLTGNTGQNGGGANESTLNNCTLAGNSAIEGGGAYLGTLNNCILSNNSASYNGGGAIGLGAGYDCTLNNCLLTGNSAQNGGGAYYCTLNNCTLAGNSASYSGGGVGGGTPNNCIVYYNVAGQSGANYSGATFNYSCTTPLPSGEGNFDNPPLFVDQAGGNLRLQSNSLCINSGNNAFAPAGTDLNSFPRVVGVVVDVGAYEFQDEIPLARGRVTATVIVSEGNAGTTNAVVTVGLATSHSEIVSVDFATIDGTAGAGNDYVATNGTLVFNPGETNKSITVMVLGDVLAETNETFFVRLTDSTNISLFVTQAIVTIRDDDPALFYVNLNSATPVAPYTSWATAATNIQDAIDAAADGDEVVVTNGVYQTGGRVVDGPLTNRVAVSKPITVRSVNGPEVTVIQGNGERCAYLADGAMLSGFTLTNGSQGVMCASLSAVVSNCVISGNGSLGGVEATFYGGGAYQGTLKGCVLTDNSALEGGGAYSAMLYNCALYNNSALIGGGATESMLYNCTLVRNSANQGGGVWKCQLINCIVYHNTSRSPVVALTDEDDDVIGVQNIANHLDSTFFFSCTTPLPSFGIGNISADPQLASLSHLSATSPCRGAGVGSFGGVDIDGEAWANPPSMGCDEFRLGQVTGPLMVSIKVNYTNPTPGFALEFQSQIDGQLTASRWEFDDGMLKTNQLSVSRQWAMTGDYPVVLRAYNESFPQGVSATAIVHVVEQPVHYVALNNTNPIAPYTSWATAATNIQNAVDAAGLIPGTLVLVSNGVFQIGTRWVDEGLSRVAVTKPLTVRSVNGPEVTMIVGNSISVATNSAVRCVYLTDGATLAGFTLTNGLAYSSGGGLLCASANATGSNCVIIGNSAYTGSGGGAFGGTLNNCTFSGNSVAFGQGGGAAFSTVNQCVIDGNSASYAGGGTAYSTLKNCVLKGNSANGDYGGGGAYLCVLTNCILTGNQACCDYPQDEYGSILNHCWLGDPRFVSAASGNFRLQSNSPCINAGINLSVPGGIDLDGNPRIVGGTVNIGAYEFQSPLSQISYAWLDDYGLPINPATDSADPDGDRSTNYQEWRAGTDPTYALSVLRMFAPAPGVSGVTVSWQSEESRKYYLERSSHLGMPASFSLVKSNIIGQEDFTTLTDTNAVGPGPFFYRVGVHEVVDEDEE